MSILDRIDPQIAPTVLAMPDLDLADLAQARREYRAMEDAAPVAIDPRVTVRDLTVPARGEHPPVRVRVFAPAERTGEPLPGVCWIHGGGYVFDSAPLDAPICQQMVLAHHCIVVSVAWRLAPEHPFPAATEDCYGALAWMAADAGGLGIDPGRLVVGGQSSGGGSAAGVALLVRDRKEFTIAHQLLVYPMLDDRNDTPSAHLVTDTKVWNRSKNAIAWKAYLGERADDAPVSPYAAPSRMQDLGGSVPATMLTGELDLFRDENIAYAQRLMAAGVPTELHVYPGAPHGFDQICPQATVSQRFAADRDAVLRRVFAGAAA